MTLTKMPLNNFRGGLNVRDSPFELQPNESPSLLNVTISALVGQLETRKGKTRYDASGMPEGHSPDFAKQCVIGNGKRFLMLSINGGIYSCNPAGEVKKLFAGTAGTIWDFEVFADAAFKDWVYCGNGVDTPQKWGGEAGETETKAWPVKEGSLPNGGVLCVWENRMFISYVSTNVQRLYFSEYGDPEATIKEYGFVDVRSSQDDLDAIQDIAVLGARLIVLKRRDVFYISNSATMLNRHIGGPGAWSRFQVVEMEEKLWFWNPQGIFMTAGVTVAMESGSINNYFPEHLNAAKAEKVRMIVTKDTYPRILLAMPIEGSEFNNILIEMVPHINFRRIGGRRYLLLPAFMLHTITASALAAWNPTGTEEILIAGWLMPESESKKLSRLSRIFHSETDEGTQIEAFWQSAWLPFQVGDVEELYRLRRLNVNMQGDARVDVYTGFQPTSSFSSALPEAGKLGQFGEPEEEADIYWEGGKWEGGIWGGSASYRFSRVRPETFGRFQSLKFSTLPGGKPFLINAAELLLRGGKEE